MLVRSVDLSQHRARDVGVTLHVQAMTDLEAPMDAGPVRQAIENVVDNARRYAPPGSEITVSAVHGACEGDDARISVADRGAGFSPEFLPHALERFRRPDDGRARSEGGAGLGLALVASIADSHGGECTAENREGGGAVVTIIIPAGGPSSRRSARGR